MRRIYLVEVGQTFRGAPKPFYYQTHAQELTESQRQLIVPIQIESFPAEVQSGGAWSCEAFQRNAVIYNLARETDVDEVVIVVDVDEVILD